MRVLIIGGSRFIGKKIAEYSVRDGHEVHTFNRGNYPCVEGAHPIPGDVEQITEFRSKLRHLQPDRVVHCIAYTEKHARDCIEVFRDLPTRILVLSSVDCYDAFQRLLAGEDLDHFPVHEGMPTTQRKYYWRGTPHAYAEWYDKNLVTLQFFKAFHRGQICPTIFRLTMVYGAEDYQMKYRHGDILRRILDRRKLFPMTYREQGQVFTYAYVENIAAAIVHSYNKENTIGQIYNLGESQVRTRRKWAQMYAEAAGWEFEFSLFPGELMNRPFERPTDPSMHLVFDCTKFVRETGFVQPLSLEQGIARTLKWVRDHPMQCDRIDYELEERVLQTYRKALDTLLRAAQEV